MTLTNWAGNITFGAAHVHRPGSLDELQSVVAASDRVRALGSGHSFSPIADTTADLVSVAGLPATVEASADRTTATVAAGMRYGEVAVALEAHGLALHNLGSLPHISVAGAVATGTHGSGPTLGSLSTAVLGLDLVTATGALLRLDRTDPRFPGAVVALGALGVVTAVTLAVQPTYDVAQTVYQDLPVRRLATDLDEILAAGYSVSLFTTWSRDVVDQVWVKRRTDDPRAALDPGWLDTHAATRPLHPVPGMSPASCTEQLGLPGPWHERLPHFRLDHTPSSGAELQTEYLVPRQHGVDALDAVQAMAPRVAAVLQVSELRTVAADDLWLSPAYEQDSLAVHFTWVDDAAAVAPVVAELEQRLAPFGPRPHWGKVFTLPPAVVQPLYPRLADVAALRRELDPDDVFGNAMVDRYLDVPTTDERKATT
jgi:xylitol oxidase